MPASVAESMEESGSQLSHRLSDFARRRRQEEERRDNSKNGALILRRR